MLLVCAQTGGMLISKMFSPTLTTIWKRTNNRENEQRHVRIAMPANTKIIAASEIKTKSKVFTIRRSLFDTETA